MRTKTRASDIDWTALDAAAAALDDATTAQRAAMAEASRAVAAAADTRAAEIERLNRREGASLALIARHLGISRQAVDSLLTSYRKRQRDHDQGDQGDTARDRDHT